MKRLLSFKRVVLSLLLIAGFSGLASGQSLEIKSDKLELTVGDTVELAVSYIDTNENEIDTAAAWSVEPHQLATVSNKGLLIAKSEGEGVVVATLGELSDTVDLFIDPPEIDPDDVLLPAFKIVQGNMEIKVGDTIQYSVVYIDTNEVETDTLGIWSLHPDSLGTLDSTSGQFIAARPGEGRVEVYVGDLTAWVYVSIFPAGNLEEPDNYCDFILMPADTVLTLGQQLQYTVYEKAENGGPGLQLDTSFTWSLNGMSVGSIDQNGLLDVNASGYALVRAELGDVYASALVIVRDSSADDSLNNVIITRDSPNTMGYSVMQELKEGEIWTLGGLPFPMNVLNGGSIYFPVGSLTEDIRIHIGLPLFSEVRGDSVGWNGTGVVGGIDFTVIVNDSVSEPYYFETPLIVGLVYKRGLIDKMNIDPNSLALYFAVTDADSLMFDSTGITNTVVDLNYNRIFSGVVHFSSLAVIGESISTRIEDEENMIPSGYSLEQNYPNPFNPVTSFSYTLPEAGRVSISIFDLTGRNIETIVDGYRQAGTYPVKWDASAYATGIYFYRLSANGFTTTKKMVFMK